MKKLILLVFSVIVLSGCNRVYVGNETVGDRACVPISKDDVRLTITKDYILVEKCNGINGFRQPWWICTEIVPNNDTIQEVINKIQVQ